MAFIQLYRLIILITLLAFFLRLIAFLFLYDWVDDGFLWVVFSKGIHEDPFFLTRRNWVFLPLYAYVGAVFIYFTDLVGLELVKSLQLLNTLLGTLTVVLTFLIADRITDDSRIPFLSGLILATNPVHIFYSVASTNEILFGVFLLFSIWFFIEIDTHSYNLFFSGLCFSLACLVRYESWALVPLLIPFFAHKRHEIGNRGIQLVGAACVGLLGIILWTIREAVVFNKPWRYLNHYLSGHGARGGLESSNIVIFDALYFSLLLTIISITVAIFALLFLPFILIFCKEIRNPNLTTVYFIFGSFVFILSLSRVLGGNSGWVRYLIPILPQTMILGVLAIIKGLDLSIDLLKKKFSKLQISRKKLASIILGIILIFYMIVGCVTIAVVVTVVKLDRHHGAIEAGRVLEDIYSNGTIICDLPSVITASNIKPSLFFDSINFFVFYTSGSIKERLEMKKVSFIIWTNADYSHLEDHMPYINGSSPPEVAHDGVLFSRVYHSTCNSESKRIIEQALIDIYQLTFSH